MSERVYSASEEKRFLDAMGRALLSEFPNPERIGCPDATLLKGIASHKVPLAQADPWLDHITSCSPCYGDFRQFRQIPCGGGVQFVGVKKAPVRR